ncbi:MAG: glycosyltransferase family 1 protein [Candidatus Moraniibacteriota bacterium]
MKIGINASFLRKPGNGIGQVTLNALKSLAGFDFKIFDKNLKNAEHILYLEEDCKEDFLARFERRVFLPFYKRDDLIRKVLWEKYLLPRKVSRDGCEEFISFYQCPTVFSQKIKHTMVVHDIIPELFPEYLDNRRKKLYWYLTKKAIKKADKIIAVSQNTRDDLIKHFGIEREKIEVRYIDVDEIYKREISPAESEKILQKYNLTPGYIYTGGGLEKRKNIQTLIIAYKELLKSGESLPELVISGKLMPALAPLIIDVEKMVAEEGLGGKVKILDFVPQQELPAIYKNALFFAYPSLYEGFGMPVLEALNQGVPVLSSERSSLMEVAGLAALYFDPENIIEIKERIKRIIKDEGLQRELVKKGTEQVKRFSWEKFIS